MMAFWKGKHRGCDASCFCLHTLLPRPMATCSFSFCLHLRQALNSSWNGAFAAAVSVAKRTRATTAATPVKTSRVGSRLGAGTSQLDNHLVAAIQTAEIFWKNFLSEGAACPLHKSCWRHSMHLLRKEESRSETSDKRKERCRKLCSKELFAADGAALSPKAMRKYDAAETAHCYAPGADCRLG